MVAIVLGPPGLPSKEQPKNETHVLGPGKPSKTFKEFFLVTAAYKVDLSLLEMFIRPVQWLEANYRQVPKDLRNSSH